MATTYPAARNLCVAATSRWCPEHLNAYSNSNKTWSIVGLSGRVWWECVGRELASSWPGGKVSFSARDGPPGAARQMRDLVDAQLLFAAVQSVQVVRSPQHCYALSVCVRHREFGRTLCGSWQLRKFGRGVPKNELTLAQNIMREFTI